jgi:malonate decarboxylase delta subunit
LERYTYQFNPARAAAGSKRIAIAGVVASGNLEVLLERCLTPETCTVEVATPVRGFDAVWDAVIRDFIERRAAGGLHISINDGGARPDTVALRLAQGLRMLEIV